MRTKHIIATTFFAGLTFACAGSESIEEAERARANEPSIAPTMPPPLPPLDPKLNPPADGALDEQSNSAMDANDVSANIGG